MEVQVQREFFQREPLPRFRQPQQDQRSGFALPERPEQEAFRSGPVHRKHDASGLECEFPAEISAVRTPGFEARHERARGGDSKLITAWFHEI